MVALTLAQFTLLLAVVRRGGTVAHLLRGTLAVGTVLAGLLIAAVLGWNPGGRSRSPPWRHRHPRCARHSSHDCTRCVRWRPRPCRPATEGRIARTVGHASACSRQGNGTEPNRTRGQDRYTLRGVCRRLRLRTPRLKHTLMPLTWMGPERMSPGPNRAPCPRSQTDARKSADSTPVWVGSAPRVRDCVGSPAVAGRAASGPLPRANLVDDLRGMQCLDLRRGVLLWWWELWRWPRPGWEQRVRSPVARQPRFGSWTSRPAPR